MMRIKSTMTIIGMAVVCLAATMAIGQSSVKVDLPKVGEPATMAVAYFKNHTAKVRVADKTGEVRQYLDVWEDDSGSPNVVAYVLLRANGTALTVVWGRGVPNNAAIQCKPDAALPFAPERVWVAVSAEGGWTFKETDDDAVKGLFVNLVRLKRETLQEPNAWQRRRYIANTTQRNIITFLKEKNRKKWFELGWLQPPTDCLRLF